jgi:opine dehydrogenase
MSHVLILGAGNGGLAAAADLVRRGFQVALYNRSPGALEPLREQGGVRYEGVIGEGFAPLAQITTDLSGVVAEADFIMACVPATAHAFLARALAPHLKDGQRVLLNPGGMLGSLAFLRELRQAGFVGQLHLGETGTLTTICRKPDPASIRVTSVLREVPFAALPGRDSAGYAETVRDAVPNLQPLEHILATGLTNVNAVLHPPAMLLAAAWIEHSGGDFYYYYDTATPSVGRLMAALDRERLAVAAAWGVQVEPFLDLFARIGSTSREAAEAGDHERALRDSTPNRYIKAPPDLSHRYMLEDIPFGVVPLADLGRAAGVDLPVTEALITLASTITDHDFRAEGRTLPRLGLASQPPESILRLLREGPI